MAFCSIGCLLVLVAHYGLAEPVIDDAEPGGNITLKCGVDPSKINQYAHARVSWYRQEPDGRIQIVTSLSTGYLKDGRYSGGIDNKNGQYNLTIAGLRRNDSAVYFCIARAAALQFAPGSSTKLVVSDPLTVPSVELYSPGLFEGDSDWTEPVPVLCLVRDTSPGRHRVNWTIGAEAALPGSAEEGEIEPDGSYSVRSYVTISADQWNSGAVKCEAYNVKNVTEKVSASLRRQERCLVQYAVFSGVSLLALSAALCGCALWTRRRFKPGTVPAVPSLCAGASL
ncbi:immunoglobulin delta heavy chain-like [Acipenser oxyrinchus oxyrinchus]|nr:immunoglobulin delta heavy chain-like [Acipenser oxyrinchus oxyrinchus]